MPFSWLTEQSVQVLGFGCATLLLIAVAVELVRQRWRRRLDLNEAWRTVEDIAKNKELSREEWDRLAAMIRRWSPADPRRAVTVGPDFEACVESEMNAVAQRGNAEEYEHTGALLRDIRTRLGLDYVPLGHRILTTRDLFMSQEVFVCRASDTPPQWARAHVATIDEAYFCLRPAGSDDAARLKLRPDEEVRVRLWREEDARYIFTTRFVREDREPHLLLLHHSNNLTRVQSRDFFRVRHDQNTTIGILNAPVDGSETDTHERHVVTKLRGRITNISAGGLAMVVPQAIPAQVLLRVTLEFDLLGAESVTVDAKMVASTPLSGGRYLIRATFFGVDDETRDIVARYVMHRQQSFLEASTPAE